GRNPALSPPTRPRPHARGTTVRKETGPMNRSRFAMLGLAALGLGLTWGRLAADPTPTPRKEAAAAEDVLDAQALAARIDRHINARLAERGVKPAAPATDA